MVLIFNLIVFIFCFCFLMLILSSVKFLGICELFFFFTSLGLFLQNSVIHSEWPKEMLFCMGALEAQSCCSVTVFSKICTKTILDKLDLSRQRM